MGKQQVRFTEVYQVKVGGRALVYPVDHPSDLVSNESYASTSPVVSVIYDKNGDVVEFETMNTHYIRKDATPQTT